LAVHSVDGAKVVKLSDGKEEKHESTLALLGKMIEVLPKNTKFSAEESTTGDPNKSQEHQQQNEIQEGNRTYSTDAVLDAKIKAIQAEKKCSYSEAYQIVIQEVK